MFTRIVLCGVPRNIIFKINGMIWNPINKYTEMHNNVCIDEIQLKTNSANNASIYFAMNKTPSSKFLSDGTKQKLYTSFVRPMVMYACGYMVHNAEIRRQTTYIRKGNSTEHLRTPVRLQNGECGRRKNEDLEILFNKPNIRLFLKAKRLEWDGYVWRAVENITINVLIENPTKKRPTGRPCQRWLG